MSESTEAATIVSPRETRVRKRDGDTPFSLSPPRLAVAGQRGYATSMQAGTASWIFVALAMGCSRATPTTQVVTPASTLPMGDAGADGDLLVRVHRYGGGPASLDHTLTIGRSGAVRLVGHDALWCTRTSKNVPYTQPIDTRGVLTAEALAEIRTLTEAPALRSFPGAKPPAHAPASDGVAAEVSLPGLPTILVDGVREVTGPMGRLLDLDRDLARQFGTAAACQ